MAYHLSHNITSRPVTCRLAHGERQLPVSSILRPVLSPHLATGVDITPEYINQRVARLLPGISGK